MATALRHRFVLLAIRAKQQAESGSLASGLALQLAHDSVVNGRLYGYMATLGLSEHTT